jgi:hypothetical protein
MRLEIAASSCPALRVPAGPRLETPAAGPLPCPARLTKPRPFARWHSDAAYGVVDCPKPGPRSHNRGDPSQQRSDATANSPDAASLSARAARQATPSVLGAAQGLRCAGFRPLLGCEIVRWRDVFPGSYRVERESVDERREWVEDRDGADAERRGRGRSVLAELGASGQRVGVGVDRSSWWRDGLAAWGERA